MSKRYWLFKSEPTDFSFDDLLNAPQQTTAWTGVRNYQARNFMRDDMKRGDAVLYYHSSTKDTGVVGLAEVVSEPYPDPTQFDKKSNYFDEKASVDKPRWFLVDIRAVRELERFVPLDEIKAESALAEMRLVQRGNRLSVMPVKKCEFDKILVMAKG